MKEVAKERIAYAKAILYFDDEQTRRAIRVWSRIVERKREQIRLNHVAGAFRVRTSFGRWKALGERRDKTEKAIRMHANNTKRQTFLAIRLFIRERKIKKSFMRIWYEFVQTLRARRRLLQKLFFAIWRSNILAANRNIYLLKRGIRKWKLWSILKDVCIEFHLENF